MNCEQTWKENNNRLILRLNSFRRLGVFFAGLALLTMAWGCAHGAYSVDMKYYPKPLAEMKGPEKDIKITVSTFTDLRKTDDKQQIGWVWDHFGGKTPVYPRLVKPSMAVTLPVKEIFQKTGYQVAVDTPVWNLKEDGIQKEWGPILVGGSIDELEVYCVDDVAVKKYRAKAKITVILANTQTGRVFYKVSANSTASLDHVLFSEGKLAQQINTVLTDVMDKIFEGKEINDRILAEAAGKL
ncbi:MAG TPA: hypothetical protein VMT12_06670 [Syntrophales bacterium]|nr:hypothetical protein [Syntrophales bacterium]